MSARADCRTRCRRAADLFRALQPSAGALLREEAGGAVMSGRKVPAVRYTAQKYIRTRAVRGVATQRTEDNPRRLGKSVEDPKEDERLMSV